MDWPFTSAEATLSWVAVLLAIAYLALVIRESILCWLCGGTSSAIYVYLTGDAGLVMQAALHAFYVAMAVYGWWQWRGGASGNELPVARWPWQVHAVALGGIGAAGVTTAGWLVATARAALPYADVLADATITYAALWTTFLVARKELRNWGYWFVIDIATVMLLVRQGLATAAIPFMVYLVMIPFGYVSWRRSYDSQAVAA